jgi:hypothetical protein
MKDYGVLTTKGLSGKPDSLSAEMLNFKTLSRSEKLQGQQCGFDKKIFGSLKKNRRA